MWPMGLLYGHLPGHITPISVAERLAVKLSLPFLMTDLLQPGIKLWSPACEAIIFLPTKLLQLFTHM